MPERKDTTLERRKMMDCRRVASDKDCTLTISGTEEEVLAAGLHHAISVHGHPDTPEFRDHLRRSLEDEPPERYAPYAQSPDAPPPS